ncbi:50S ribosomal protein L28, chloroplastic [Quercus robur]|uniref:50S ribosomal protein L28, chloroplastic n=1 Tax=Quercus robur TaxID=38942 RepID=UPI002161DDED|nr:50S ribosomal protein L28, chloroplastic [Quercus robur]
MAASAVCFGNTSTSTLCFRRTGAPVFSPISSSSSSLRTKVSVSVSVSELGFLTSQLSGTKISDYNLSHSITAPPFTPPLQPIVARRICPFTGKKANRANKVSFSNHKTKKLQFVNLQYKRVWWEAGKRYVKLRLSTKALKTIEKNGLDAVAKKAGIDLRKE